MKILFIWFGLKEPLYAWRHNCIVRAKEVYPDAEFQVITTLKEFYGMEIIDAYKIIKDMETMDYYHNIHSVLRMSDELRFWWLARNKDTLYLDTDTWCKEPMPYSEEPGKLSIEALWSGKDTSEFERILKNREKNSLYLKYAKELELRDLSEYFEHKSRLDRTPEINYEYC